MRLHHVTKVHNSETEEAITLCFPLYIHDYTSVLIILANMKKFCQIMEENLSKHEIANGQTTCPHQHVDKPIMSVCKMKW